MSWAGLCKKKASDSVLFSVYSTHFVHMKQLQGHFEPYFATTEAHLEKGALGFLTSIMTRDGCSTKRPGFTFIQRFQDTLWKLFDR
jgi:hypothetical protein